MMVHREKQRQLNLLKWLTIALALKLVYLDVFPGASYVQHLLMYLAFYKSLSYDNGPSLARRYIQIGFGLLLVHVLTDGLFSHYWLLILTAVIDLLIVYEFFKIIQVIEEECKQVGSTTRIMKKYMWLAVLVIISWTFLMNVDYSSQMVLLIIGAVILFGINIRLLLHIRRLKKQIRATLHFVTYS